MVAEQTLVRDNHREWSEVPWPTVRNPPFIADR
jgi:hypothetical protein